jgi:hypothetical protein
MSDSSAGAGKSAEIRALNRHLVSAQDAKVLKVVAMVDALPQRGQADALIAPLRPRLAQLRPRRPLNFGRLLFTPLNAVIVPGPRWRRGAPAIPRTALPSLIAQIEQADPTLPTECAAGLVGASADDTRLIRRVGNRLWPAAAAIFSGAQPPIGWEAESGLAAADHAAIAGAAALVLAHAPAIMELAASEAPEASVITSMLQHAARVPAGAMGVLIGVLLNAAPGLAAPVLAATTAHAAPIDAAGRAATERAVEAVLEQIDPERLVAAEDQAGLASLRQTVAMLDQLAELSIDRPSRTARIAETRVRIDAACRARFDAVLQTEMVERLELGPQAGADEVARLETAARNLRGFEQVARRVNGSDHYDRMLRRTASMLAPRERDDPVTRVDRLRLAEILLGPEVALNMLATIDAMEGVSP